MDTLLTMLWLLGLITLGYLLGRFKPFLPLRFINRLQEVSLWILLFLMGFQTGRIEEIKEKLALVGGQALLVAVLTLLGTFFLIGLAQVLGALGKPSSLRNNPGPQEMNPSVKKSSLWQNLHSPLLLIGIVIAGLLVGLFTPLFAGWPIGNGVTVILSILLLCIGWQTGMSPLNLGKILLRPATLILPLMTAFGSLVGGLILSLITTIPLGKALAVSSGFGWYSLSGILIQDLGDPLLGTVAFLGNLFRESLSFILIPLFAAVGQSNLAIGSAGATSMDVTLPLLQKSCGPEALVPGLSHGVLLSLLVPILVPLFFRL